MCTFYNAQCYHFFLRFFYGNKKMLFKKFKTDIINSRIGLVSFKHN